MPDNKVKKTNVNKKDLTVKLASRAGIPKTKASQYIDQITEIISEALMEGKKVFGNTLPVFWGFQVKVITRMERKKVLGLVTM